MECALCTETCIYYGLTECEHRSVCSLCWYRLCSLLKNSSCPVCRHECRYIFITSDLTLSYSSVFSTMWGDSFPGYSHDELSNLYFGDSTELNKLLAYRKLLCKICDREFKQTKLYKEHISQFHQLRMCEQCLQNNKLFASEQVLYDEDALRIHKITMHIQCDLCFSFHYDQREVLTHLKSQHFYCELCAVEKKTAFASYNELEMHFRKAHYLCEVEMCREMMNIVFMRYDDLKDHYRTEHSTIPVPAPVLGFRVREEEQKTLVFEDTSSKNYTVPKIDEKNKNFEFPALALPAAEQRHIDYNIITKTKPKPNDYNYPQIQTRDQNDIFFAPKQEKGLKESKKAPNKSKEEVTELDRNISRLNSGHLNFNQLVEWIVAHEIILDSTMISFLRNKILSNTDKEKVIGELQSMKERKKKDNDIETEKDKEFKQIKKSNKSIEQNKEIKQKEEIKTSSVKKSDIIGAKKNELTEKFPDFPPLLTGEPISSSIIIESKGVQRVKKEEVNKGNLSKPLGKDFDFPPLEPSSSKIPYYKQSNYPQVKVQNSSSELLANPPWGKDADYPPLKSEGKESLFKKNGKSSKTSKAAKRNNK